MSVVAAGFHRGIAEKVDSFLRPPPFGLELYELTGCRMRCGNDSCVIRCSAEVAHAVWWAYDRVLVDARQYIEINGRRCWSEVMVSAVNWAGQRFPLYFRSTHLRVGHTAVIDAEYTVTVFVPAGRLWEHRRWCAGELEDPPLEDDTPPLLAPGQVAILIEQLEGDSDSDSDSDL